MENAKRFLLQSEDGKFPCYNIRYPGYRFVKENCPECGKEVRVREMIRTYDCHGIPYRLVCRACCDKIYEERGFDGEKYTEADEELGYDY